MRMTALVSILVLAAVPAIAQDAGSTGKIEGQKPAMSPLQPQMSTVSPPAQQKLRESLERAGFTDIQIVDAIHARTSDGNLVVMYVNPPSVDAKSATTGERRTETPPAPEAPEVDRSDAHLDKYKASGEKSKPDPFKER
jgi:hypothetical protein